LDNVLKVLSKSNPNSIEGAIAGVLREKGYTDIQAIKAIARGIVAPSCVDLVFVPASVDVLINNENRTAIKLICIK
jgi:stage V sporulation protein S